MSQMLSIVLKDDFCATRITKCYDFFQTGFLNISLSAIGWKTGHPTQNKDHVSVFGWFWKQHTSQIIYTFLRKINSTNDWLLSLYIKLCTLILRLVYVNIENMTSSLNWTCEVYTGKTSCKHCWWHVCEVVTPRLQSICWASEQDQHFLFTGALSSTSVQD